MCQQIIFSELYLHILGCFGCFTHSKQINIPCVHCQYPIWIVPSDHRIFRKSTKPSLTWGLCHSGMLIFFVWFIYLKTISMFPWFIIFQTSPVHCLYALDLLIWCAIFFCHYNLKKEELLFSKKVAESRSCFT